MKNISVYSFVPKVLALLITVLGGIYFFSNWKGLIQYAYDEIVYEQVEGYIKLASREEGNPKQFVVDYWFTKDGRMESGKQIGSYSGNLEQLLTRLNDTINNEQQVTIYLISDTESKIGLFSFVDNGDYIQSLFIFLACLSMATTIFSQGTRQLLRLKYGHREPWKAYSIYGDNRIVGHVKHRLILLWSLSIFWLVFGLFFCVLVSGAETAEEVGDKYLLIYIFPAIGFFLLIKCMRDTWQWLRLGKATLYLLDFPPQKGRSFSGAITIDREHDIFSSYKVELIAYSKNIKSTSADNRVFSRSYDASASGVEGKTIVKFEVDLAQLPEIAEKDIEWRIQLCPNLPDIDPRYIFDIPVCEINTPSKCYEFSTDLPQKSLHKEGFGFKTGGDYGATEYREPGFILIKKAVINLIIGVAMLFGGCWILFNTLSADLEMFDRAMGMVPVIIMILIGILILYKAVITKLFFRSKVVVFDRNLKIVKSMFGSEVSRIEINKDDIKELLVQSNPSGRRGKRPLDNGITKYDSGCSICLIMNNGDEYRLFENLANDAVADYLVSKLQEGSVWKWAAT